MNNISGLQILAHYINQTANAISETTSPPIPAPEPIPLPAINVTDLYIGNLHLGEMKSRPYNLFPDKSENRDHMISTDSLHSTKNNRIVFTHELYFRSIIISYFLVDSDKYFANS